MNNEIVTAVVLGLVGGVIPGPVLAATFTEILQSGFPASLRIIFWAMLTETLVALSSLIILSSLDLNETFFRGISFIGAGVLVWIATSIWKIKGIETEKKVHFRLATISAMILANGVLWTYWITVCVPKAIFLSEQIRFGQYLFLGLVEIGWLFSTLLVALIFSFFRKLLANPRIMAKVFKIFALVFVYFALNMIYGSCRYFLSTGGFSFIR